MSLSNSSADADMRWGQRHPRLVAAIVSLVAGSAVSILWFLAVYIVLSHLTTIRLFKVAPPVKDVGLYQIICSGLNIYVLSATFWFFVLWSRARQKDIGPFRSILLGIFCIFLSHATVSIIVTTSAMIKSGSFTNEDGIKAMLFIGVLIPIFGSLLTAFLPQIAGGIGGYIIWRIIRNDRE